jgi:hypothetical protein
MRRCLGNAAEEDRKLIIATAYKMATVRGRWAEA